MMAERGVEVDHTTLYLWVQHYAPEMEKRLRNFWRPALSYSWCVDETGSVANNLGGYAWVS